MGSRQQIKPGDLLGGKYRIERVVGEGGMGIVLAATDVKLGRTVAIKALHAELADDAELVARFLREARAVARLSSEHSVRVHDVGELPDHTPYIVMEYLAGRDLGELRKEVGRIPLREAVDYLLQAIEAIADAHAAGIVHRDIKPANLFLTRRTDTTPLIKVLDFGLAKAPAAVSDSTTTRPSALFGSPQYMSPEQLRGSAHTDTRTDIWSLGVTLHQLILGVVPFDGGTLAELSAMIMRDPVTPPHERFPDIPRGLSSIILRCLEKDPRLRYANVVELATALEPYASASARGSSERVGRVLHRSAEGIPQHAEPHTPRLAAPAGAITATVAVFNPRPSDSRWRRISVIAAALGIAAFGITTMLLLRTTPSAAPVSPTAASSSISSSAAMVPSTALDAPIAPVAEVRVVDAGTAAPADARAPAIPAISAPRPKSGAVVTSPRNASPPAGTPSADPIDPSPGHTY